MMREAGGRKTTLEDYQERLNRVLLHIQQHLDEPLSLEAVAPAAEPTRIAVRPAFKETPMLKPEIRTRQEARCVFVRRTGRYEESAQDAWSAVCGFAFPRGLVGPGSQMVGISHDDPSITAEGKLRYDACITVDREVAPEGEVGVATIAGGKYAVFTHRGPYQRLSDSYREIYGAWIPSSGVKLRDVPGLEIYLNSPDQVKSEELLTEICVPIE